MRSLFGFVVLAVVFSSAAQADLAVLSADEMQLITGASVYNDRKCADGVSGCGSACLPTEGSHKSKQARDQSYTICRDKYWFEASQSCYNNQTVCCGQWRYYASDNCGGTYEEGDLLWAAGCAGQTTGPP